MDSSRLARPATEADMAFYRDISTSNDLEAVIKAAIHVEREVLTLLSLELYDAEVLDSLELSYFQRVGLSIAVGLDPRFLKPMKTLGSVRNRFAHRTIDALSKSDADNLYNAFSDVDKQIIQSNYSAMVSAGKVGNRSRNFAGLPALERFTICVTTLRSAIVAAQIESRRNGRIE